MLLIYDFAIMFYRLRKAKLKTNFPNGCGECLRDRFLRTLGRDEAPARYAAEPEGPWWEDEEEDLPGETG